MLILWYIWYIITSRDQKGQQGRHLSFTPAEQFHIKAPGFTETTTNPEAPEFALAAFLGETEGQEVPFWKMTTHQWSMINMYTYCNDCNQCNLRVSLDVDEFCCNWHQKGIHYLDYELQCTQVSWSLKKGRKPSNSWHIFLSFAKNLDQDMKKLWLPYGYLLQNTIWRNFSISFPGEELDVDVLKPTSIRLGPKINPVSCAWACLLVQKASETYLGRHDLMVAATPWEPFQIRPNRSEGCPERCLT